MIPFIPHLANECLELLKCSDKYEWPEVKKTDNKDIKFAVQINGKTKDIITMRYSDKETIMDYIINHSKANKF